jgi:hypothetical protein
MFFRKLGDGLLEVIKSRDSLRDIEYYIGRFPYRSKRVAKHSYLQFHAEAFFHEVYILQLRLQDYLTLMERQYRKDPRLPVIRDLCEALRKMVTNAFDIPVRRRGSHVHQYRMYDDQIDRLTAIQTYGAAAADVSIKFKSVFRLFYEEEYRKCRRRWRKWMADSNGSITKLLDAYFAGIYAITFNKNGTVRYPSNLTF